MIIVLKSGASDGEIADVERRITAMGYRPHTIRGQLRTVIGAIGDDRGKERLRSLESLESVESVTPILQPFKLASREVRSANSIVRVGDVARVELGSQDYSISGHLNGKPSAVSKARAWSSVSALVVIVTSRPRTCWMSS